MENNRRVAMQRYKGVYTYKTKNGDTSYSISYKNTDAKKIWETVGLHSDGIRGAYCEKIRSQRINTLRLGEDVKKLKIGRRVDANIKTLNMIFDYYIENKSMRDKSKSGFIGRWNKYFRNTIGEQDISKVTVYDIIKLRDSWDISQKTKSIIVGIIGSAVRFTKLHNEDYQDIPNPIENLKELDKVNLSRQERKEKRKIRERYLETDEIFELKDALKDNFPMLLAVELMLSTGARIGGILTILKRHVKIKDNKISIIDHKSDGETYFGFITPALKKLLIEYLPTIKSNTPLVSKSEIGIPYRTVARQIQTVLNELFNDGIDTKDSANRIVLHSLRHTFASHLAINGTPLYNISKLLNHKDISMTMRYAKLAPDSGNESVMNLYKN